MFGKSPLNAVPFHEPTVMVTITGAILGGLVSVGLITYPDKWTYLWKGWLTPIDHEHLGIMYIIVAIAMLLRGFADAIIIHSQQVLVPAGETSFLLPHHYDQIFIAHGVIMVFFVTVLFVIGPADLVIPLQVDVRDVAFPFLDNLSLWFTVVGIILINVSPGAGEFAQTGWLIYLPLSEIEHSPEVGVGYWIWSFQLSGIGTMPTGADFFVIILKIRVPGMAMFKMPAFTWASLCANVLIIVSFPILMVTIVSLTLDRYPGTCFFTSDTGGNMMTYINLIQAWGHPEAYILILPVFGMSSETCLLYTLPSP